MMRGGINGAGGSGDRSNTHSADLPTKLGVTRAGSPPLSGVPACNPANKNGANSCGRSKVSCGRQRLSAC